MWKWIFAVCIGISLGTSGFIYFYFRNRDQILSPVVLEQPSFITQSIVSPTPIQKPIESSVPSASPTSIDRLAQAVDDALSGTTGTYAVSIRHLKSGESYNKNEHRIFEAASLYKLWVMGTVYEYIENGTITEDTVLSQSIPVLNRKFGIDPEYAELTVGNVTMTVKEALTQMITISHNYAALLLSEKVGLSNVQKYISARGFSESKVGTTGGPPVTTASDVLKFYSFLLEHKLSNEKNTGDMMKLLYGQTINHKIPKYIPPGIPIAHKTGELGYVSHDTGIVSTKNGDYIIVVLTESTVPTAAEERIALISKKVFEYLAPTQ